MQQLQIEGQTLFLIAPHKEDAAQWKLLLALVSESETYHAGEILVTDYKGLGRAVSGLTGEYILLQPELPIEEFAAAVEKLKNKTLCE